MKKAEAMDLKISVFCGISFKSKHVNVEIDGKTTTFFTLLVISFFHPELLEPAICMLASNI